MSEQDKYRLEAERIWSISAGKNGDLGEHIIVAVASALRAQAELYELKINHYIKESFDNLAEIEKENAQLKADLAAERAAQGLEIERLKEAESNADALREIIDKYDRDLRRLRIESVQLKAQLKLHHESGYWDGYVDGRPEPCPICSAMAQPDGGGRKVKA